MASTGLKKVVFLKKEEVKETKPEKKKILTKEIPKKTVQKKAVKKLQTDSIKPKKIIKKKNIYPKLGQTKPTPPETDSLRKFYTSLLTQNSKSEMAIKWCTEHGLMPKQEENTTYSIANSISKLKI